MRVTGGKASPQYSGLELSTKHAELFYVASDSSPALQ